MNGIEQDEQSICIPLIQISIGINKKDIGSNTVAKSLI